MDYMIDFSTQFLRDNAFLLINVIILIFILSKLLYKPVRDFIGGRNEKIANNIKSADDAVASANKMKADYEAKLANIEKERTIILEDARKAGKEQEAQIIAAAREEAEVIRNRAEVAIKREEERAKDDMRKNIIDLSTVLASSVITKNIDEVTQNKLLDEVIEGLGEVKW